MAQVTIRAEPLTRSDLKKASLHNSRALDELHVDVTRTMFNQCLIGTGAVSYTHLTLPTSDLV